MMVKLYKVLKRQNGKLVSLLQKYEYEPSREYVCKNFDEDKHVDCSYGFYATGIEGLIYSFCNLPGYEVWEVEVGGRSVEINPFKRRYERIKLIRLVPLKEVKELALAEEERLGYKLSEVLFPVNPFEIEADQVTDIEIELLKKWALIVNSAWVWLSVKNSIEGSVGDLVWNSVWGSVGSSVRDLVWSSVRNLAWDLVWGSHRNSIWNSFEDSVGAYISSLFPNIKKWKYIDHPEGENPFQPCIHLWYKGLVPSFDGKVWRLHAGEKAEIVWEGTEEALEGGGE